MEDSSEENVLKEDMCDAENYIEWRIIWQGKDKWNLGGCLSILKGQSAQDILGLVSIMPGSKTKRDSRH